MFFLENFIGNCSLSAVPFEVFQLFRFFFHNPFGIFFVNYFVILLILINEMFSPGLVHLGTHGFTSLLKEKASSSEFVGGGIFAQILGMIVTCSSRHTYFTICGNCFGRSEFILKQFVYTFRNNQLK